MIDWLKGTAEDTELALKIAKRAVQELDRTDHHIIMDIMATHTHGCELRLQDLLDAKSGDFFHDVCGIGFNLNRDNGQLEDGFWPRYAVSQSG